MAARQLGATWYRAGVSAPRLVLLLAVTKLQHCEDSN